MSHRTKRLMRGEYIRLALTGIAVFAAAYFLLGSLTNVSKTSYIEAKFSDVSESGLSVVPASGGSANPAGCVIAPSEYTSVPGRAITLSWYQTGSYYPLGTAVINPGSMNVGGSGSRVVNPTVTTTYVLDMASVYGQAYGYVQCQTTVSVAPPSCPNGLNYSSYGPSCTCPAGQVQNGATCIVPACPNGLNISQYPTCQCPAGQVQSGTTCVASSCANGLNINEYPTCQCPANYVKSGNTCIQLSCPNGLNIFDHPSCICPAGQVQSGTQCITPQTTCPNGLDIGQYPTCVCPTGQTQSGNSCVGGGTGGGGCVSNTGSACQSAANSCGMRGAGTIQCNGSCNGSVPSNSMCSACWDGSAPNASGQCPACPVGYTQSGNACIPPAGPTFTGFPTTNGFNATGHLEVRPSLVRTGDPTRVYWNVSNVRDCTVRGTNGDGVVGGVWNALSSGASGIQTSPITTRTDYTLFSRSLTGATPSTITETRTVNVLPSWFEPSGD